MEAREKRHRELYDIVFADLQKADPMLTKERYIDGLDIPNPYNRRSRKEWHLDDPIYKNEWLKPPPIRRTSK